MNGDGPAPAAAAATVSRRALGALSVRGGDISFTALEEQAGNRFYDPVVKPGWPGRWSGSSRDTRASWVRQRLWVSPPAPGYSDLDTTLRLALRAKRAGLKLLLDPHYSDFWADPGKQVIPAGWPTDSLAPWPRPCTSTPGT